MSSALGALKTATAVHHERLEQRVDIERALASGAIADAIDAATVEHAGAVEDDVAIVVLRRR